ncbi:hypothetical protein SAMN06265219_11494 [Gracilimonas mengyeensis]|uniref:Uncharacterized protein n=1 Tax=Gracilimonas mengyeensis TaxID=1302730 RepID=A0A521F0V8_9BACT|nr:hypothetical protein SAMN06265219_11494 [Gracilimonas mengyeensis]
MKVLSAFLVMVLGGSTLIFAQLDRATFPFSYLNTNVKSLSLGNATVSLDRFGNEEISPAVVGEEGETSSYTKLAELFLAIETRMGP